MQLISDIFESLMFAEPLMQLISVGYLALFVICAIMMMTQNRALHRVAQIVLAVCLVLVAIKIGDRWIEAGRPPFKTFYEATLYILFTSSIVAFVMDVKFRVRALTFLLSGGFLFTIGYILSHRDLDIVKVAPALQTWIFIPHVSAYILSYGTMLVAFFAAVMTLIKPSGGKGNFYVGDTDYIDFEDMTYQVVKFGFLCQTTALLLGAWWGQVAWQNYWGWDPKENWALISWCIFIVYLHMRQMKKFNARQLSMTVITGFTAILFTYVGMQYLPTADQSLHVYTTEEDGVEDAEEPEVQESSGDAAETHNHENHNHEDGEHHDHDHE